MAPSTTLILRECADSECPMCNIPCWCFFYRKYRMVSLSSIVCHRNANCRNIQTCGTRHLRRGIHVCFSPRITQLQLNPHSNIHRTCALSPHLTLYLISHFIVWIWHIFVYKTFVHSTPRFRVENWQHSTHVNASQIFSMSMPCESSRTKSLNCSQYVRYNEKRQKSPKTTSTMHSTCETYK